MPPRYHERFRGFRARVGLSRWDITPPAGAYARNWGAAKHWFATGVHCPLTGTALAMAPLSGAGNPLLLISLELGWWRERVLSQPDTSSGPRRCASSPERGDVRRQLFRMANPANARERCPKERGRNQHGLRREKHRLVPRRHRELVLLVIGGDKLVEAKFHHRNVQQVGGPHRLVQPMFAGESCDGIKDLVIVHFEKAKLARLKVLFKQRQARMILRHREQHLAGGVAEPGFASGDMENFNLVEAGQQGRRIVLLQQGKGRRRIGFRPV